MGFKTPEILPCVSHEINLNFANQCYNLPCLNKLNTSVKIIVNGEEILLPEHSNIQDLIAQLGFSNKRIAIEVNALIIPKSKHQSHFLESLDRVEVINAVGGG